MTTKALFPGFNWSVDVKKSKRRLDNALQIQYIIRKTDVATVVQAINIFAVLPQDISGSPQLFDLGHYSFLKIATLKQWILALTWEENCANFGPEMNSLLASYILYYEKVLDRVMDHREFDSLESWAFIEQVYSGQHTNNYIEEHQDTEKNLEDKFSVEMALAASISCWEMEEVYKMDDLRLIGPFLKKKMFLVVSKWLAEQCTKEDTNGENVLSGPSSRSKKQKKGGEKRASLSARLHSPMSGPSKASTSSLSNTASSSTLPSLKKNKKNEPRKSRKGKEQEEVPEDLMDVSEEEEGEKLEIDQAEGNIQAIFQELIKDEEVAHENIVPAKIGHALAHFNKGLNELKKV